MIFWFMLAILFIFTAFYAGIITRSVTLVDKRIHSACRIIVVSDLHSTRFGKNQHSLISKIRRAKPDLIVMPGDIIDDHKPLIGSQEFLSQVSKIAPCYYTMGNHEHIDTLISVDEIMAIMEKNSITVLTNRSVSLYCQGNNIILAGIDDPRKYARVDRGWQEEKVILEQFQSLKNDPQFKILLAHRPEYADLYAQTPFDLVISGHAHGGQVRIPFLVNGLFAPQQGFFPKYAGGVYRHDHFTHIVSRGLCRRWFLPRIFNPCELVLIRLQPSLQ